MPNERWRPGEQPQNPFFRRDRSEIKFGNRISLFPPAGGIDDLSPNSTGLYLDYFGRLASPKATLLRVTENDIQGADEMPGSWVLVLQSQIKEAQGQDILPIVANITMGAGGARQSFQVDATRCVIPLPSPVVDVEVGWDYLSTNAHAATVGVSLPAETVVTGTLERSFSSSALMTRTKMCETGDGTAGSGRIFMRLEPFVRSWRIYVNEPELLTDGDWRIYQGISGAGQLVEFDSDLGRIYDMARYNCERVVPPVGDAFRIVLDAVATAKRPYLFVQELGF